jgi:hypothetical protein
MVLVGIIISSKRIAVIDEVGFAKNFNRFADFKLFCTEKIFRICLAGLVEGELKRQFLPAEGHRKWVFPGVWRVDLPHLNCVVCKEKMYDEVAFFRSCEEF